MSSPLPTTIPVLKIEGPPGSGKTRELAREACRLIVQDGYAANKLVMLSATLLGKKRLKGDFSIEAKLAGYEGNPPTVQTLNQWLLKILQTFSPQSEVGAERQITLLKETEAQVLLQEVLRQVIPAGHPLYYASRQASAGRAFMGLIQQLQLQGFSAQDVWAKVRKSELDEPRLALVAEIYQRFEAATEAGGLVCYAQLVHRVFSLLENNPQALATLKGQISVILADEAQAFSFAMYRLLALLGKPLVLAGNEKLSIRSFRGADPEQFKTLEVYQDALDESAQAQVSFVSKQACFRGNEAILSLLNEFLPQPIWESHELDKGQLEHSVKFGYFANPQQEAERVAAHIAAFVHSNKMVPSMLEDEHHRPARWSDCVVLLRSGHYQQHLLHAFQQQGIPYRWEMLSAETIRLQHGIYDLFKVFSDWQALKIKPSLFQDVEALSKHWATGLTTAPEQLLWTAENNRHLLRALETLLLNEEQISTLRHLPVFNQENPAEVRWLLPELVDSEIVPPNLAQAVADLSALYVTLTTDDSALALLQALLETLSVRWLNEDGFTAVMSSLQAFQENLARLDAHYQASFKKPLPLKEALENFRSLWEAAESSPEPSLVSNQQDTVRIMGLHQVQGEEFPLVVIPFLVSGEFPYTRELPELISPEAQTVLGIAAGYQIEEAEEARLLAVGMTRAKQQVLLSTHAQGDGEVILPSNFFTQLLQAKRRLLEQPLHGWICRCRAEIAREASICSVDYCVAEEVTSLPASEEAVASLAQVASLDRYTGSSLWSALAQQSPEPLFEPQETLNISASSIKTYMECPRKFYYKHLLRLPQPSSDAAALGSLIHRVMEVFNRQAEKMPYTAESLTRIAEALFLFDSDESAFEAAGFEERDRHHLSRLSPLGLSQLRQRLLASIEDLVEKGYFERYGSLRRVYPEKTLENIALPGIERARFRGAMDAVIELADGSVEILDYKTFRSAYGTGLDTCDKYFLETLEPLPDDEDLVHSDRFAEKLRPNYPTDYQLPLYYLACQQDPAIGKNLKAVALQIVRPAFPENPYQGSIRLQLTAEQIEARQQQLVADINRYIVSPILESGSFEPNPSQSACSGCAYFGICEVGDDMESVEDGIG